MNKTTETKSLKQELDEASDYLFKVAQDLPWLEHHLKNHDPILILKHLNDAARLLLNIVFRVNDDLTRTTENVVSFESEKIRKKRISQLEYTIDEMMAVGMDASEFIKKLNELKEKTTSQ